MMLRYLAIGLCGVSLPSLVDAQGAKPDSRYAATFAGGGSITWQELHVELARRHRGKKLGKEALAHLIEKRIVEIEAGKRGVKVPSAEIDAWIQRLQPALKAQRLSLEKHLAERGMSMKQFRSYARLSILYERLASSDLGLPKGARLEPAKRKLWLREKQRIHRAIDDAGKLPTNVAAQVGGENIGLAELGQAMTRSLVEEERYALLRQMVAYRLLQGEARRNEIEITAADRKAALARKRNDFGKNPEYKRLGVTLESLLKAQGRTIDDLRNGEVFRAEVIIHALGAKLFPTEKLENEYDEDIVKWHRRIGTSREVSRILLRGPPKRSLEEAKKLCERIRKQIRNAKDFGPIATRLSEDLGSRHRGGNLGYLHRDEHGVDESLLKATFGLAIGKVSEPVRDSDGYSLLVVTRLQPGPRGKDRIAAIRQWKVAAWLRELVKKSEIQFHALPRM